MAFFGAMMEERSYQSVVLARDFASFVSFLVQETGVKLSSKMIETK
jgi:hypothetical protein